MAKKLPTMWRYQSEIRFFLLLITLPILFSLECKRTDDKKNSDRIVGKSSTGIHLEPARDHRGHDDSGNRQTGIVNSKIVKPLRVRVLDGHNRPLEGVSVYFSFTSAPHDAGGYRLSPTTAVSDQSGQASTDVTLGNRKGGYAVSAMIREDISNPLSFTLTGFEANWLIFLVFGLLGGLAVFLFGMDRLSSGLKRSAGDKLKSVLSALTSNRLMGVAVGCGFTAVVQSSSATTVILVGLVHSGLMSLSQSMGVILGADIGTTLTVQLIAFRITDYALIMIGIGFFSMMFAPRENLRFFGEALLGLGLIFFGMHIMSESMEPLRSYHPLTKILINLENPLIGILTGTIFTAIIQSSGAFAGILIVLAQQGLISLESAIPLLLGANIGTCITAVLASLQTNQEARRVAAAHTLFKVLGVLLIIGFLSPFTDFIRMISPSAAELSGSQGPIDKSLVLPRQLANAHTVFNVGLTVLFLPFTTYLAILVQKLLPDAPLTEKEKDEVFRVKYLDARLLSTPSLALNSSAVEILRAFRKAERMLQVTFETVFTGDEEVLARIKIWGQEMEFICQETVKYLKLISMRTLGTDESLTAINYSMITNELLHISRAVGGNMRKIALDRNRAGEHFSADGENELRRFFDLLTECFREAVGAFENHDTAAADRVLEIDRRAGTLENVYRISHIGRLSEGSEKSLQTSGMHIDLLEAMRRISNHLKTISVQVHMSGTSGSETHSEEDNSVTTGGA